MIPLISAVLVINPKNHGYKIDVNIDKCMELDISPKVTFFLPILPILAVQIQSIESVLRSRDR